MHEVNNNNNNNLDPYHGLNLNSNKTTDSAPKSNGGCAATPSSHPELT